MKYVRAILTGAFCLLAACGQKEQVAETATAPPAASASQTGVVTLPPDSPKLKQIRVEEVKAAQVPTDEVVAPGKIEANPNHVSHVALPLAGRVSQVFVHLGDYVKQGDPLLTEESTDVDAAMSAHLQADSAVNQTKSAVLKAQADLDRQRDLYEHNAVAKKEVLNAESALVQSKAALEQAEAVKAQATRRLDMLGLQLNQFGQKLTLKAPISGKILEMSVTAGEFRNDTNAPVMTIADLSTVWVSSDVPESDIRLVQVGERLEIELAAYPGETFNGRVTRIADTVDPQTRTIKVRAEMDNRRGRFRPEMFGRIRHVEALEARPVVPPGAVIQGDGQNVVYVEKSPGTFVLTPVKIGPRGTYGIPVLEGLHAGDRVVVDGVMLLKGA